jgi:hypothetical protein
MAKRNRFYRPSDQVNEDVNLPDSDLEHDSNDVDSLNESSNQVSAVSESMEQSDTEKIEQNSDEDLDSPDSQSPIDISNESISSTEQEGLAEDSSGSFQDNELTTEDTGLSEADEQENPDTSEAELPDVVEAPVDHDLVDDSDEIEGAVDIDSSEDIESTETEPDAVEQTDAEEDWLDEDALEQEIYPNVDIDQGATKNYRPFMKRKVKSFKGSQGAPEETEAAVSAPVREPAEIQKEIDQLLISQTAVESRQQSSSASLSEAERAVQEFAQFVTAVENSIAWRVKSKFENNLKSVDSDLEKVLQVSEGIDVSEVGYLVKIRRLFLRRFWKATLFAILAVVIFVILQRILADFEYVITEFIVNYPLSNFVILVTSLWVSSIFTFIVWYYKTWSGYERSLRLSEVKLVWVRDSLKQTQESKSKLTKLYAHAEQWIGLIALSLHHPWQTDPKWEQASGSILSDEKLPNAVTVAQAVEGSAGAMAALERTAVARLLRPGWREQIFMRQIAAVAKHQGIQPDKYNIETFDKDSPSIPNGSRNFFVDNFRDSLVQLAVARSYLSELSIEVQTVGLLESKPPVKNDYVDDLSVISEDLDLLGEVEVDQAWDGFLLDIVGSERDPIIPISPFSFTDRAVIENSHGLPNVHIQMPMRLRSLTENLESNRILISAYEDSARLPLDLVVRVDFVGPLEPEMLKLWSKENSGRTSADSAASQAEVKASSICRNCGRRDCPAGAPGSNAACTYSGV